MSRNIAAHPFTVCDASAIQYDAGNYHRALNIILKALKSKEFPVPRVYVAEPPEAENPTISLFWSISFDIKVTELVNKGVSVIDPTLLKNLLRDGPRACQDFLFFSDPFFQDLLDENLVDVLYLPEHHETEESYKTLCDMGIPEYLSCTQLTT